MIVYMMHSAESIVQTLEMPIKETKQGVLTSYLELRLKGAQIIATIEAASDTDNRLNELVDWMISTVPSVKFQDNIRKKRDDRIINETKGLTTNEERGRKIKQINREISGEISAYMDRYTGGERSNRISFIVPIKEMEDVLRKANPEHFTEHLDTEKATCLQ